MSEIQMASAPPPDSASHLFAPNVLREYDIRGIVGLTLDERDAYALGRVFGAAASEHGSAVAVGRDGRLSSPALETALVAGLVDAGMTVECIGIGPTPMLYFAVHHRHSAAGVMVTGSHNPPDQNGFKMVIGARAFYGAAIRALGDAAAQGFPPPKSGAVSRVSVFEAYIDRLTRDCDAECLRPLAVAWDTGNGAAGAVVETLVKRLPGRHILLNNEIDGRFPAHHPDPTVPQNLRQLQATVRDEHCDLGLAFDGDGDRLGVVDSEGSIIWGDQLLTLFARDIVARYPGSVIIGDVKSSQTLFDEIATAGGIPLMWKSGHALLRSKLAETGGPFAGEMSGHFFFADTFYGHDDAIYAAIRFLGIASRSPHSVAALRRSLKPTVATPEMRFPCEDARKATVLAAIEAYLAASGATFVTIDGVRVITPDGWWLLRASNTEAMLTARCEAASEAGLERVTADFVAALRGADIEPPPM